MPPIPSGDPLIRAQSSERFQAVWPSAVGADTDLRTLGGAPCAGIYVGSAGALTLTPNDGSADQTLPLIPAGTYLAISASKIKATGSTAFKLTVVW